MAPERFSDETLMAYTDGELDDARARIVEAAAGADPGVAERIALFRDTAAALAEARAVRPEAPVSDDLMARVQATLDAARPGTQPEGVVAMRPAPAGPVGGGMPWAPMALAASLALAVGLGAGWAMRPAGAPLQSSALVALEGSGIAGALSRIEAGSAERVAAGELSVVASFRTPDGVLCREFELSAQASAFLGIACAEDGSWDLRFAVANAGSDAQSYVPAGALEALDAWLMGIGAGAPLSPEDETTALDLLNE